MREKILSEFFKSYALFKKTLNSPLGSSIISAVIGGLFTYRIHQIQEDNELEQALRNSEQLNDKLEKAIVREKELQCRISKERREFSKQNIKNKFEIIERNTELSETKAKLFSTKILLSEIIVQRNSYANAYNSSWYFWQSRLKLPERAEPIESIFENQSTDSSNTSK